MVIDSVYQRLSEDKEVQGCIRQIKAHPWVRVVEDSDIDVMAVVIEPPRAAKLK